jgi:hypothetical protein
LRQFWRSHGQNRLKIRGLGFALQQVGEVLREGVDTTELQGMLRLRRAELERQVDDNCHRLALIHAWRRLIESEYEMSAQEIVVKHVEPMRVAALSDLTEPDETFASFVEELFIRAGDLMDAARLSRTTPVSWYVPEPSVSTKLCVSMRASPSRAMHQASRSWRCPPPRWV